MGAVVDFMELWDVNETCESALKTVKYFVKYKTLLNRQIFQ